MASRFSVGVNFSGTDNISGMMNRMSNNAVTSANKMTSVFSRAAQSISNSFSKVTGMIGFGSMIGAAYTLGKTIKDSISQGMALEQTLVRTGLRFPQIVKQGTTEFEAYKSVVKDLGSTTRFTVQQVASAGDLLAASGVSLDQIKAGLKGFTDTAVAMGMDVSESVDVTLNSLKSFGLFTDDAEQLNKNIARVSDTIITSTNLAKMTIDDFKQAALNAAPTFRGMGLEIEDMASAIALLAEGGKVGSDVGTGLKIISLRIVENIDKFKKMGIAIKDAQGRIDFAGILKGLETSLKGVDRDVTMQVLKDLFGDRGVLLVQAMLEQGIDKMTEFKKTIIESSGATSRAAKENAETTFEAYMRMQSAIDGVKQELFEGLKPAFKDITALVVEWGNAISAWLKKNPDFIKNIADTAKKILDLLPVISGLVIGIMAVVKAFQAGLFIAGIFGAAAGGIVTVVILIVVALGALAAAIWQNWDLIKNFWIGVWYDLEEVVFSVVDWIIEKIGVVKDFWIGTFSKIGSWMLEKASSIKNALIDTFSAIGQSVWEFLAQPLLAVVKIADKVAKFAGGEGFGNMIYTLEMYGGKKEGAEKTTAMPKYSAVEKAAPAEIATAPIPSREITNNVETRYIFIDKNGTETDMTEQGDHGWFTTTPVPMN